MYCHTVCVCVCLCRQETCRLIFAATQERNLIFVSSVGKGNLCVCVFYNAFEFSLNTVPLMCGCLCVFLVLRHQVMFSGTLSSIREPDLTCVTSVDEVPTRIQRHTHTIELDNHDIQ